MNLTLRRRRDDQRPRRHRKGLYLLPSMFTTANIAAGYYAILQAMQGSVSEGWHFDLAAKAIGFAIIFDGVDGTVARLTNTASDFGKELDSLADVIAFGLAPAVLAFMWGFRSLPFVLDADLRTKIVQIGAICTFMFLAAGAARLARFNIQTNPQPSNPGRPGKKYFVGMPIPAGAGCIAAIVHFRLGEPVQSWITACIWMAFVVACAFLMVSTWRFWSAKNIDWHSRQSFRFILLLGAILAGVWYFSRYVLFALALTYMLSGVLTRLVYALRKPTPPPQDSRGTVSEA